VRDDWKWAVAGHLIVWTLFLLVGVSWLVDGNWWGLGWLAGGFVNIVFQVRDVRRQRAHLAEQPPAPDVR
jgi:hypothetical protein